MIIRIIYLTSLPFHLFSEVSVDSVDSGTARKKNWLHFEIKYSKIKSFTKATFPKIFLPQTPY